MPPPNMPRKPLLVSPGPCVSRTCPLALDASLRADAPLARRFASMLVGGATRGSIPSPAIRPARMFLAVRLSSTSAAPSLVDFSWTVLFEITLDAAFRESLDRELTGVGDHRGIDVLQHSRAELHFLGDEVQLRIGTLESVELDGRLAEDVFPFGFFRWRFRVRGRGTRLAADFVVALLSASFLESAVRSR